MVIKLISNYPYAKLDPLKRGALAQLVERNNGIVEVIGSIPLRSISVLYLAK